MMSMLTTIRVLRSGRLGRDEEAVEAFKWVIRIRHCTRRDADAYYNKGLALSRLGRHGEAVEAFESALGIDPEHADAENALRDLDRDDEAAPDTSRHSVTRSSSGRSGRLDAQAIVSQVEDFFNKAFRPNQGSGLEGSGNIASGDVTPRQSSEVVNETTSPTSQHPETPPSGEHENVSPTETESTPLNPGDADAHYQKGLELKARGRHREARDAFEYALLLDPGHIDADNALIEALLSDAHRLNQGSSLEGSENVASGDATPRQRSEEVNETTSPTSQHPETPPSGERENVLPTETVVNESTPLNLENVDAHYQRGLDLKARWRHREAVEIFEQVILLKPDNADAYYQKGLSYSRLGKHAEALKAFEDGDNPSQSTAYQCSLQSRNCAQGSREP